MLLYFCSRSKREGWWNKMPEHYTQEALAALDEQIAVAQRRYDAALLSMGDDSSHETWHDNPAFEQAKQDVDMTLRSLQDLRTLRNNAVIVEREKSHLVEVGSTLRILMDGDEEPTTVHLAGHFVAGRNVDDQVFKLATTAPMGAALLGRAEGEHVTYRSPSGQTLGVTILEFVN